MFRYSRSLTAAAVSACAGVVAFGPAEASGQIEFDTAALTGAAGTALGFGPNAGAGVDFNALTAPGINASGEVAFQGQVTGGTPGTRYGLFSNASGAVSAVAGRNFDAPGPGLGPDVQFFALHFPIISDAGVVAFHATFDTRTVNPSEDGAMYSSASGNLTLVAREGAAGPGPNLGATTFRNLESVTAQINASGVVAFKGFLDNPDGVGIFAVQPGGPTTVVMRTGAAGPGPNLGPNLQFGGFYDPAINDAGRVAVHALLNAPRPSGLNDHGIFTGGGGAPNAAVARLDVDGPLGPGLGTGVTFNDFGESPSVNSTGNVAFRASLAGTGVNAGNNSGVFTNLGPAGRPVAVARTGGSGPRPNLGAGVNFASFTQPLINNAGDVAFLATLTGPAVNTANDSGIFITAGGTPAAVAREGEPAPINGGDAGVLFGGGLAEPAFNARGEVAFLATLTGTGVDASNNSALFTSAGGELMEVVRTGKLFDVDPGAGADLRTIAGIVFITGVGNGEDGRARAFTDDGLLAFKLLFTNGSEGVFTAAVVPEPTGALLFAAGSLTLLGRRRRRK